MVLNWILVLTNTDARMQLISIYCIFSDSVYPGFGDFLVFYRWTCIVVAALMYIVVMVVLRKRFKLTSRAFAPSMTKTQSQKIMRSNVTMGMTTLSAVLLLLIPDVMLHFSWPIQDSSGKLFLYLLILNKTLINFLIFFVRHRELRGIFVGTGSSIMQA
ncbi:hypothetical protein GCK32_017541 [Trichostrongylus colubriformis]|uniref:G-protein coupled receptors family 1 profile domain-containing protein n=1 Tax=Trichostrongylus colubriformis TaxID=6319 RepID=A0AAN8FEG9_TRICO